MIVPLQLTLLLEPSPESERATPPHHRYEKNGDGKVICRRCTVERREAPTGRRQGFRREWRVLSSGQWVWTTVCPPCLPSEPTARRSR